MKVDDRASIGSNGNSFISLLWGKARNIDRRKIDRGIGSTMFGFGGTKFISASIQFFCKEVHSESRIGIRLPNGSQLAIPCNIPNSRWRNLILEIGIGVITN